MERMQFEQLDDQSKGTILKRQGVLLESRFYKCFKVILVRIDNFYVEVYYHIKFKVIQLITSFEDTENLEPYLSNIDITTALVNHT